MLAVPFDQLLWIVRLEKYAAYSCYSFHLIVSDLVSHIESAICMNMPALAFCSRVLPETGRSVVILSNDIVCGAVNLHFRVTKRPTKRCDHSFDVALSTIFRKRSRYAKKWNPKSVHTHQHQCTVSASTSALEERAQF